MSRDGGLLAALREGGQLRAVDLALADSLRRLDPDTPDAVLAAAALASHAVSRGHAAFDPARARALVEVDAPPAEAWLAAMRASRWVSWIDEGAQGRASDPSRPLVLERGLLYLRRYREYEHRLADRLRRLATQPDDASPVPEALFDALFPPGAGDAAQAAAARLALSRRLALVTGGPGTGKTTTIARVLLLLIAQARAAGRAAPRIALAAPTGRAAERMVESLRHAVSNLRDSQGIDDAPGSDTGQALLDALPQQATTLHRLLGLDPDSPRLRFGPDRPLPHEVIVVDEASMVDLPLMCKLVEAVADGARLLLLADPDQLPSVETGDVLASIAGAATAQDASPLHGHLVHLQRGWRQSASLDLAPLADAVREGDTGTALELLRGARLAGVSFHEDARDLPGAALRERLVPAWEALRRCDPAEALRRAAQQRLLTALRDGPQGAATLNERIEHLLAGASREPYFPGRLLLVTRNSHHQGLSNGDLGVCLPDAGGNVLAWFPGSTPDAPRAFHPAALPTHESAFAMTVHKAQGSEFDEVWLQLPRTDSRVLSRELLYTAITRARSVLHVAGSAEVIASALGRHAGRVSGLGWRLRIGAASGP